MLYGQGYRVTWISSSWFVESQQLALGTLSGRGLSFLIYQLNVVPVMVSWLLLFNEFWLEECCWTFSGGWLDETAPPFCRWWIFFVHTNHHAFIPSSFNFGLESNVAFCFYYTDFTYCYAQSSSVKALATSLHWLPVFVNTLKTLPF